MLLFARANHSLCELVAMILCFVGVGIVAFGGQKKEEVTIDDDSDDDDTKVSSLMF